jgi:hypothetical protein
MSELAPPGAVVEPRAVTTGGLPYPLPSAPVANGAADIRALAEAVDARAPYRTATGTFLGGPSGAASFTTTVTFPASRFTAAPVVTTNLNSGTGAAGGFITRATGINAASFTLYLASANGTSTTFSLQTQWCAVQMLTTGPGLLVAPELADEVPPPPLGVVTCPTDGCGNEGIEITVPLGWWDGEAWQPTSGGVVCGVCGATLEVVATP